MHAKLFHLRTPDQRCLDLAAALHAVAPSLGANAVRVASDLYRCAHPEDHPATIAVQNAAFLPPLRAVCAAAGICLQEAHEEAASEARAVPSATTAITARR